MPNEISSKTREQLEALCRQISVSRNLDDAIRKELFGHMEDRLLAHLSGEQPLTEQEAFILVREHFGDAGAVKAQFQGVHVAETAANIGRLTAMAITTLVAIRVLGFALDMLIFALSNQNDLKTFPIQAALLTMVPAIALPGATYLILARWRKRIARGESPCHQRTSAFNVTLACIVAAAVEAFLNQRPWMPYAGRGLDLLITSRAISAYAWAALLGGMFECAIWLRFCDRPPRASLNVWDAAAAWVLAQGFLIATNAAIQTMVCLYDGKPTSLTGVSSLELPIYSGAAFLQAVVYVALTFALYWVVRQLRRKVRETIS